MRAKIAAQNRVGANVPRRRGTASQLPLPSRLVHKDGMAKAKVDFRPNRIDEGNWKIVAVMPGQEDRVTSALDAMFAAPAPAPAAPVVKLLRPG